MRMIFKLCLGRCPGLLGSVGSVRGGVRFVLFELLGSFGFFCFFRGGGGGDIAGSRSLSLLRVDGNGMAQR